MIEPSLERQKEIKFITKVVANNVDTTTRFDLLLEKHELHKALRILAWINRFIHNCRYPKQKGPLGTSEIQKQRKSFIIREQSKSERIETFQDDKNTSI